MFENLKNFDIVYYFTEMTANPLSLTMGIIDIALIIFIFTKVIQISRGNRAWQLLKGLCFLIIITIISYILNLKLINYILTSFMSIGVISIIILFQPELRRALEELGTSKLTRFFGIDKDIVAKTKENIYKIVIAAMELSKTKTGGLIVIERDIKIKDIINTGIQIDAEISPQLLVNIFVPNTPLHDGAVVISENKIAAAACMLPLASDHDIAKELGTRHRAAIGISKESDSIVVVVSEETGKVSVAKDGTLIADVKEEALKKILIKNIITQRFLEKDKNKRLEKIKAKLQQRKNNSKKE